MTIKDLNNAVGVIFLILPALLWAFWSFRLYDSFEATKNVFEHKTDGILGSTVCPFGKAGAVFIIFWSVLLIALLLAVVIIYWSPEESNNLRIALMGIGWTNVAIMIIVAALSLIMNPPLFIRTLPFYFIQIGINIMILNNVPEYVPPSNNNNFVTL